MNRRSLLKLLGLAGIAPVVGKGAIEHAVEENASPLVEDGPFIEIISGWSMVYVLAEETVSFGDPAHALSNGGFSNTGGIEVGYWVEDVKAGETGKLRVVS